MKGMDGISVNKEILLKGTLDQIRDDLRIIEVKSAKVDAHSFGPTIARQLASFLKGLKPFKCELISPEPPTPYVGEDTLQHVPIRKLPPHAHQSLDRRVR